MNDQDQENIFENFSEEDLNRLSFLNQKTQFLNTINHLFSIINCIYR